MNFIEMIGFVVSLIALFALAAKKAYEERRRRANPEEYEREEREQAEKLKAFLRSIDMDMEDAPKQIKERPSYKPLKQQHKQHKPQYQPQPQRASEKPGSFLSNIENRKLDVSLEKHTLKSSIKDRSKIPFGSQHSHLSSNGFHHREDDAYGIKRGIAGYRGIDTLKGLKSNKEMIILHEIISPPKALREP